MRSGAGKNGCKAMRISICLCVVAVVTACQPRGAAQTAPSAAAEAGATTVRKADAAGALQVTLLDAQRTRRLQPSRFEDKEPAPGDSFLVLDVSVRNPGRDTRVFNAGPLVLVADGREHRVDTPENILADGYLLLEALKPGASLRGRIVYEVPAGLDGATYWLPGNGQRLLVQATPVPSVTGNDDTHVAVASHASSSAATPTTTTASVAPVQLRALACRALVDDNDPVEQARYRSFFDQHCKGYARPAAWRARASTTQTARATDTTTPPAPAHAAARHAVAAEPAESTPQVVPSDSGPSFDCARAVGRAEQLVCDDALLSLLDRQLAQAVSDAERKVTDPTELVRDQDDWRVRVRDACQTLDCLEHVYTQRTAGLRAIGGFADVK